MTWNTAAAAAKVATVVSDSVWTHRWQPTRLPCPWDSPGKNTGVGCHFLLQCMKVKSASEVAWSCLTLSDPMDCSLPGSSHGIFHGSGLPLPSPDTPRVGHQIYDKGGKSIQWGIKESLRKWCWENWTATWKRIKLKHSPRPYTHTKILKID